MRGGGGGGVVVTVDGVRTGGYWKLFEEKGASCFGVRKRGPEDEAGAVVDEAPAVLIGALEGKLKNGEAEAAAVLIGALDEALPTEGKAGPNPKLGLLRENVATSGAAAVLTGQLDEALAKPVKLEVDEVAGVDAIDPWAAEVGKKPNGEGGAAE